ncbi:MAG: hypothetical protein EOM54_10335 [Clostridia bacterium]|nr:hypothetical protein [Clostridia bacterium]
MSTAYKHMKRSHRSSTRARAAFGNMSTKAYIRASDSETGKPLAAKLKLFHRRVLKSRNPMPAEGEAQNAV